MTRIGIHAPYSRQEVTHLGLTLAATAERTDHEVSWLSSQKHEQAVHALWDSRVQSLRRWDFKAWARKHRGGYIIWFDVQDEKLAIAKSQGAQNILVPLWHRLSPRECELLFKFDHVVCPDQRVAAALQAKYELRNLSHVPWAVAEQPMCKRLTNYDPEVVDLFVPLDGETARVAGPSLLNMFELVLAGSPAPRITIGYGKHWSRASADALARLSAARPQRVRVLRRQSWLDWREIQCSHDWVVLPSIRCNSGYLALEALQSGVPVLAFDIPPLGSIVKNGHNGLLLPCNLHENWLGAPSAVTNSRQLLTALESWLTHERRLQLLRNDWSELAERRRRFVQFWRQLWNN